MFQATSHVRRSSATRAALVAVALAWSMPVAADPGQIDVSGRVFARDTAIKVQDSLADWRNEAEIASARLSATYEIKKTLKTQVEVDLAEGEVDLDDAYARYRPIPELQCQVGQFKRPVSQISMVSAWRLPIVERGLLNDRLTAGSLDIRLPFGGRSQGATLEYRPKLPLSPRLTTGVFNSRLARSNVEGVDAFDPDAHRFEDVYNRIEVEPKKGLHIGATVAVIQRVRNLSGDLDHVGVAGADVLYAHHYGRVWGEGFYGRTVFVDPVVGRVRGAMWAGRFLVAPRLDRFFGGGTVSRIEPFVSVSVFEPSTVINETLAVQAGGGMSVNLIKELKAQIEYVHLETELQFPIAPLQRLFFQVGSKF